MSPRHVIAAVALTLAAIGSGCDRNGASGPAPTTAPTTAGSTVGAEEAGKAFVAALEANDPDAVERLLSARQRGKETPGGKPRGVKVLSRWREQKLTVVRWTGAEPTAEGAKVKYVARSGAQERPEHMVLVREGGQWRVDKP